MNSLMLALAFMLPGTGVLVDQLGSDDFHEREAATTALKRLGPLAFPCLDLALGSSDAEVRRRSREILRSAWQTCRDPLVLPSDYGKLPWIDSLPLDYEERSQVICGYLELAKLTMPAVVGYEPGWPNYREATRLWVRDQVIDGQRQQDVRILLDRMAERERELIARSSQPP